MQNETIIIYNHISPAGRKCLLGFLMYSKRIFAIRICYAALHQIIALQLSGCFVENERYGE